MSISDNTALVQRLFEEVWNRGNEAALDDLLTAAADETSQVGPSPGTLDLRTTLRMVRTALPDWQITIEELIPLRDRALARQRDALRAVYEPPADRAARQRHRHQHLRHPRRAYPGRAGEPR